MEQWLQDIYSSKPLFSKNFESRFYQVRQTPDESGELTRPRFQEIIPIELSFYFNSQLYKFNLLWAADESSVTPEIFSKILIEDFGLNASVDSEIAGQIRRAVDAHQPFTPRFNSVEEICSISLKISDGGYSYTDEFEWDLVDENNDPVEFARTVVRELNLPLNFEQLISFEIHKQIYHFKRYLSQIDHGGNYDSRPKKYRGSRENTTMKIGENVRLEPVSERTLFRPLETIDRWTPKVKFNV